MYLDAPDISVITPSLNMLPYLQRCSASVADQEGVSVEHIIVDGASTDGTSDWLTTKGNLVSIVGRDSGMYEAVNRGLSDARGGILAYLNCDEQYLPGALRAVKSVFDADTDVHMVFGDSLIVGRDGTMIAYRKGYAPRWHYIQVSHLYNLSCSMFMRRSLIDSGLRFNTELRSVSDMDFVIRALRSGHRAVHVTRYLSAFTVTGHNLSSTEHSRNELRMMHSAAPFWLRMLRLPVNVARLIEKLGAGAYWERMPLRYAIYLDGESERREFAAIKAQPFWKWS